MRRVAAAAAVLLLAATGCSRLAQQQDTLAPRVTPPQAPSQAPTQAPASSAVGGPANSEPVALTSQTLPGPCPGAQLPATPNCQQAAAPLPTSPVPGASSA